MLVLDRVSKKFVLMLFLFLAVVQSARIADAQTLTGKVLGADLPISGSEVTLFAAGSGSPLSLGSSSSDSSGNFSIPFSSPGGNTVLYAIARGGNLGNGSNDAIAQMALIGTGASFATSVAIDEVTTVASVRSMAQFVRADGSISGPSPGLQEGAATVPDLVDLGTGMPSALLNVGISSSSSAKLLSLANMLVPCVASSSATSSACSQLFQATTAPGRPAPADTLAAAAAVAENPALNVAQLFSISSADQAYGSGLNSPPAAWTLSLEDSGAGMDGPASVAIDGEGNIWIGNFDGNAGLPKLLPGGVPDPNSPFHPNGTNGIEAIAIDNSNHIWTANSYPNASVSELDIDGNLISPADGYQTGTDNGRLRSFTDIALDSAGNVWLPDYINASLMELNSNGQVISPPGDFKGGGLFQPTEIAIDANDVKWVVNSYVIAPRLPNYGSVSAFAANGQPISPKKGYSGRGIGFPDSVAIDERGNIWISNNGYEVRGKVDTGSITELTPKGKALSPKKGFQTGGIFYPKSIAIDGSGNVWVVDNNNSFNGCAVNELSPDGAGISPPKTGFPLDGYCDAQQGIAIDGAGNIWIPNTGVATIIEIVGAASPVRTPLIGPAQPPG